MRRALDNRTREKGGGPFRTDLRASIHSDAGPSPEVEMKAGQRIDKAGSPTGHEEICSPFQCSTSAEGSARWEGGRSWRMCSSIAGDVDEMRLLLALLLHAPSIEQCSSRAPPIPLRRQLTASRCADYATQQVAVVFRSSTP